MFFLHKCAHPKRLFNFLRLASAKISLQEHCPNLLLNKKIIRKRKIIPGSTEKLEFKWQTF